MSSIVVPPSHSNQKLPVPCSAVSQEIVKPHISSPSKLANDAVFAEVKFSIAIPLSNAKSVVFAKAKVPINMKARTNNEFFILKTVLKHEFVPTLSKVFGNPL